ncbi:MAG: hypothetical protein U0Q47_03900 [Mycobacterium sp.]
MPRLVMFTGHYFESRTRAAFHLLAEAYERLGWQVTFATTHASYLSILRGDPRSRYPLRREGNRLKRVRPGVTSYVLFTPYHPANLRSDLLNRLSTPFMHRYAKVPLGALEDAIREADMIMFESEPGLLLFDACKRLNPSAKYIYYVSDDLELLGVHPAVVEEEQRIAPLFDVVTAPCQVLYDKFRHLPTARLQFHGVDTAMLEQPRPSPYPAGSQRNALFVGIANFDHEFLEYAVEVAPEWNYHIVGPIKGLPKHPSVFAHGELPFSETGAFLQHADVGLQTIRYAPGAESLTDTLKVLQYTYRRLPIVAPAFIRSPRPNVVHYTPGDKASIAAAMAAAGAMERSTIGDDRIRTWDEQARALVEP